MLLNTFSRNKRQKIVKNQDGSFKVPLFDLKPSECHVRCQNLIGSYASTHSTFNLITPCNKHPNTQSHKATKQVSPTLSPQSPSLFPFPPIPYPLPHTPYPFQRLLRRLNTPLRIRLLAHNLLAHDKLTNIQYFYCHHHPERSL